MDIEIGQLAIIAAVLLGIFVIVVLLNLRAGYRETNLIAKFRPDILRHEIGQRERDVELEKWREEHKPAAIGQIYRQRASQVAQQAASEQDDYRRWQLLDLMELYGRTADMLTPPNREARTN